MVCYVSWVDIHNDNTHTLKDLNPKENKDRLIGKM